jgi:glycosyltransferase involved in cell wall biosynthesis
VRIWLINPYGPIPGEGWREYRFVLIAKALAARGHRVTWWTAAFAHQTKRFRSDARKTLPVDERFTIELVPTPSYKRNIGLPRLWFEFQFARRLIEYSRSPERPDVIVAADPPQFSGWAGRRVAALHRAPLVLDCLDLWPELFVSVSRSFLRPLVRLIAQPLFALRRRNARAAALTIAVAEAYRRVLEADGARRSITIPIGVDVRAFAAPAERSDVDRLLAIYAGTLGEAYDLMTVIKAFAMLARDKASIDLVIAGRGPAESSLREAIGRMNAGNVRFAGAVDSPELNALYSRAHIGIASYSAGSTVAMPVKVFDYIAAGLPIVTSLPLELGVATARYESGNAQSLANLFGSLAADRDRLRQMSAAALALRSQFDSRVLYERFADEIEAVAAQ